MPLYLVEYTLPGVTLTQITGLRRVATDMCDLFRQEGKPVRYLRGTFLPGESRCLCLYESPTAERVREVNEAAQIPYTRIIAALDLDE